MSSGNGYSWGGRNDSHDGDDTWPGKPLVEKTHTLNERFDTIRALDARVAADMKYLDHIITTPNADWVPQYPLIEKAGILKHDDGLWGGHEYTRWPQFFSKQSIHHACIPFEKSCTIGSFVRGMSSVNDVAWYDPNESSDFTDGKEFEIRTQSQVGRLRDDLIGDLETALLLIAAKTRTIGGERRKEGLDGGTDKVYRRCFQAGQFGIERLRLLKSSWRATLSTIRDVQRAILELHGLRTYLDLVVPRMKASEDFRRQVLPVRGAFTTEPSVVNNLYRIGIPVWFICASKQMKGKVFSTNECVPWSNYVSNRLNTYAGRDLYDGLTFQLDDHLREMSRSQFMVEEHITELLEQMYGFQNYQPGAPAFSATPAASSSSSCTPLETSLPPASSTQPVSSTSSKRKRTVSKHQPQKDRNEPNINYARIVHVPKGVDGSPDLPPYHKEVMASLTKLGTVGKENGPAALYPLPPPFLLIHASAEKSADLYLNYIRIRPTLIDMLLKGGIFDKSIWRRLRDWKTILHGDYMKSTPLPPNTTDPFVERIYNRMPPASGASTSRERYVSHSPTSSDRSRQHANDLPPAKRQRVSEKATIKVVFGVERHLEPFDRTKSQQWRSKPVSSDSINRDKVLRMEVQWELSELLFRYELYALDQAILPRARMTTKEHIERNALLSRIYLGATDGSATVIPDVSKPIKEYWGEDLDKDSVDALFQVLKTWPDFPVSARPQSFRTLISFYLDTFVRYFNRIPSMHCNVPVSLM